MSLRCVILGILAASAMTSAAAGEIYKSVAPDGTVVYTDRPPNDGAQVVTVDASRDVTSGERSQDAARQRALEGIAKRRLEKDGEDRAKRNAFDAARCQKARDESAYFSHDGVTRRLEKDDSRPFYTAAEISQRRAAAKRDLAQFCPPA